MTIVILYFYEKVKIVFTNSKNEKEGKVDMTIDG